MIMKMITMNKQGSHKYRVNITELYIKKYKTYYLIENKY